MWVFKNYARYANRRFWTWKCKKDLSVEIKTTDRTFFNKFEKGAMKAQICGSCGKVDLIILMIYGTLI